MASHIWIEGNLGRDAELRKTEKTSLLRFSVAVKENYRGKKEGEPLTTWYNVVLFGKIAEIMSDSLKKGVGVFVSGEHRGNKYTDKNGVERYSMDLIGDTVKVLQKFEKRAEAPAGDAGFGPEQF